MKILIAGGGKVGRTLARSLSKEGHEITILDNDEEVLAHLQEVVDVFCVKGSATSMNSLEQAGIREKELVIAVTDSDEVNMLCCLTAKRLEVPHTIARIRDPEYSQEVNKLKRDLGIDVVINPEHQTALRIARLLRFPAAMSVDPFASGRIELVGYRINEDDSVVGIPLRKVMATVKESVLFCIVQRDNQILIPNGETILKKDDIAYVIGKSGEIMTFFRNSRKQTHSVKNAFVIGGGRIGYYLCDTIMKSHIRVKLVEKDEDTCQELDELLPDCTIIHGDGTDIHLLEQESLDEAEAMVLLTGFDEDNIITALYGKHVGVPKVIVKVNRSGYDDLLKELKLDNIVSPKVITADEIIRYVRAMSESGGQVAEMLYRLAGGQAEACQFEVTPDTKNLKVPFMNAHVRKDVMVGAILRDNRVIIPGGHDFLQEKDVVIVIAGSDNCVMNLNEIFE